MRNTECSVITFAANKLSYVKLALNCAQSILLHNDIKIFIVSNMDFDIPIKLRKNVSIVKAKPEHASLGIGMKLYIDQYIQTMYTLFIDSDCLCFGGLGKIFEAGKDMHVSVIGNITLTEDWCGDECGDLVKKNHGMNEIIQFNGGLYYIQNSSLSKKIFSKARELASEYDYGYDTVKNKWVTEELAISISMQMYKENPIPDNGDFMTDLYTDRRPNKLNVLTGERLLRNPASPLPLHRRWYPEMYSPIVLHFGGKNIDAYPYKSQRLLLMLDNINCPKPIASTLINVFIHWPYKSYHWITNYIKSH